MYLSLKNQIQHFLVISILFTLARRARAHGVSPAKMEISQWKEVQVEILSVGVHLTWSVGLVAQWVAVQSLL